MASSAALDQRGRAAVGLSCRHARLLEQEPSDHEVHGSPGVVIDRSRRLSDDALDYTRLAFSI